MSGGHWDYSGQRLKRELRVIGEDPIVRLRWPKLGQVLVLLACQIYEIEHEMDWDLSGDSIIRDDGGFELATLGALLDGILKALPESCCERGKWATIQSWQQRTNSESSRASKTKLFDDEVHPVTEFDEQATSCVRALHLVEAKAFEVEKRHESYGVLHGYEEAARKIGCTSNEINAALRAGFERGRPRE